MGVGSGCGYGRGSTAADGEGSSGSGMDGSRKEERKFFLKKKIDLGHQIISNDSYQAEGYIFI